MKRDPRDKSPGLFSWARKSEPQRP